jgi:hypothetical protein
LSLASRLIGVALALSGGWLMGSAQGAITVSNTVGGLIYTNAANTPAVGAIVGEYLELIVTPLLAPNYGTFWAFGVILAFLGLALVYRGDRKPRPPEESLPLLTEPLEPMLEDGKLQ